MLLETTLEDRAQDSMREISVKKLKANLCKELQDLPFAITKYNKVIGIVTDKGGHNLPKKVVTKQKVDTKVVTKDLPQPKKLKSIKEIKPAWTNPLSDTTLAPKKGKE